MTQEFIQSYSGYIGFGLSRIALSKDHTVEACSIAFETPCILQIDENIKLVVSSEKYTNRYSIQDSGSQPFRGTGPLK